VVTTAAVSPPAPPADVDQALQRIRDHGGRVTRAKRTVAILLFDATDPLSVDDIVERSGLEQSVVYRTLGQFEELGIAEHVLCLNSLQNHNRFVIGKQNTQ